ncbi:MAG: hypothetical protein IIB81_00980 [Nanoarchaeota archaeon]|nr:hypothetical protein [Nanoarchaeota archaeon]
METKAICKSCGICTAQNLAYGTLCAGLAKEMSIKYEYPPQFPKSYDGLRFTSDAMDCSLPVVIDSHSGCAFNCLYCFANNLQRAPDRNAQMLQRIIKDGSFYSEWNIKKLERLLVRELNDRKTLAMYDVLDAGVPIQLGALGDPFDDLELHSGWAKKAIPLFIKYKIPIRVGTKGGTVLQRPEYLKLFEKSPDQFWFAFSIISNSDEYDFIPQLWASRRIGFLLDQIRLNGEDKELVDEVTLLAREHGIVTPYTSYLIMEDEEIRLRRNEIVEDFQTFPPAPVFRKQFKADYDAMKEKSGNRSVTISKEFQGLNQASNFAETKQGSGRMNYKDDEGYERNLSQQVKNVQGRAIYQSGKFWVDSELQKRKTKYEKRIQFNTDEYFKLLNDKPETAQFLALGQNVRFYFDDTFYEIYE